MEVKAELAVDEGHELEGTTDLLANLALSAEDVSIILLESSHSDVQ
jgi:hypothetical protein